MKKWIIFVLFSILLSYPVISGAVDNTFDFGRSTMFGYQFLKFPIEANPDSNVAKENKREGEARNDEAKEKKKRDKKVDDAIKKAWEER